MLSFTSHTLARPSILVEGKTRVACTGIRSGNIRAQLLAVAITTFINVWKQNCKQGKIFLLHHQCHPQHHYCPSLLEQDNKGKQSGTNAKTAPTKPQGGWQSSGFWAQSPHHPPWPVSVLWTPEPILKVAEKKLLLREERWSRWPLGFHPNLRLNTKMNPTLTVALRFYRNMSLPWEGTS